MDELRRVVELAIFVEPLPMPPTFDALLVGRAAPVGPEGVRRWLAAVAPDQYDVYTLEGDLETVAVRRTLLRRMPAQALLGKLRTEWAWVGDPQAVLAVRIAWKAASCTVVPAMALEAASTGGSPEKGGPAEGRPSPTGG